MTQSQEGIPAFESGTVTLSTGDVEVINVIITSTEINVNIEDKAFIKRIIAMRSELLPQPSDQGFNKPPSNPLGTVKRVADALRDRGITITVCYQNHRIVTIGAGAKPTLLQYVTKTKGLAINSIVAAIRMVL